MERIVEVIRFAVGAGEAFYVEDRVVEEFEGGAAVVSALGKT